MGLLDIVVGIKNSAFKRGLDDMRNTARSWAGGIGTMFAGAFQRGATGARVLLSTMAHLKIVGEGVMAVWRGLQSAFTTPLIQAAEIEEISSVMEVMIGDMDLAEKTLSRLRKLGAETPFEFPELATAASKLIAFNESAETVPETLRRIGDISSGIRAPIGEIAEIYGKARVQGRLFAEDINQLTGRGIPIIQEFAKQFKVSDGEVKKLVESGKIGFPQLEQAFVSLTNQGGKFYNLMAVQATKTKGIWSTIADGWNEVVVALGKPVNDALKPLLNGLIEGLAAMQPITSAIGEATGKLIQTFSQLFETIKGGGDVWTGLVGGLTQAWERVKPVILLPFEAALAMLPNIGEGLMAVIKPTGDWLALRLESSALKFVSILEKGIAKVLDSGILGGETAAGQWLKGDALTNSAKSLSLDAEAGDIAATVGTTLKSAMNGAIVNGADSVRNSLESMVTPEDRDKASKDNADAAMEALPQPGKDWVNPDANGIDTSKEVAQLESAAAELEKLKVEQFGETSSTSTAAPAAADEKAAAETDKKKSLSIVASSLASIGGGGGAYVTGMDPSLVEARTQTALLRQLLTATQSNNGTAPVKSRNPF